MKTERILSRWALLMAGDHGPVLAGCEELEIMRTSTPLVEFDVASLTGVTASGRPYRLVGDPEPGYALRAFHSLWHAGAAEVLVVSPAEAVKLIRENGNAPFRHAPEEQAALDLQKLTLLAGQLRMQIGALEIGEDEAARRCSLTAEQLRGLLEADLGVISADEADAAFVRLVGSACGRMRDYVTAPEQGEQGSGNSFAGLGLHDPGVHLTKAELAIGISRLIGLHGLNVEEAAVIAGIDAAVLRGIVEESRVSGLSIERLDRVYESLVEPPEPEGRKP